MRGRPSDRREYSVFLNVPYDDQFRRLYLAYICGLSHFGLTPHATIEIPDGRNRLGKILDLIRSCRYSIHDLSRVQLDRTPPVTPRFNMPFELGLAVALAEIDKTQDSWIVFETRARRLAKSLSDLGGTDPLIHGGTVAGVMRELGNAFERKSISGYVSIAAMMRSYQIVSAKVAMLEQETGSKNLFSARAFRLISSAAVRAAVGARTFSL